MAPMTVRDYFTDEERERQEALDGSREAARAHLADPEARARIDAALADMDSRPPVPVISSEEFLVSVGLGDLAR